LPTEDYTSAKMKRTGGSRTMPWVEPFPFQKVLTRIQHLWVRN